MDREYTKFAFHYAKDYPEKTEDDAYAAYMASKQGKQWIIRTILPPLLLLYLTQMYCILLICLCNEFTYNLTFATTLLYAPTPTHVIMHFNYPVSLHALGGV